MGYRRRVLPIALVLVGCAFPVPISRGAAAQQRVSEPVGVYIDRGILAYDDKNYAEALKNFLEALQIEPENAEARYLAGIASLALDRVGDALVHLEKARQLEPADLDIAFNLGVAYFTNGDYERSRAQFMFVYEKEPKRDNLGYYLGFIHFQRREYARALAFFEGNVSSDLRFQQQNRFYVGLTEHHLGRDAEAVRELAETARLRPETPLGRTARLFAEAIAPKPEARRYRVEIRGGVSYDDNVALSPLTNALGLRERHSRSAVEVALLRLEYDLIQTQPDILTASYQLSAYYPNGLDKFDVVDHTFGANYVHRGKLGTLPASYGAQYAYDYIELDGSLFLSRHTGTALLTLIEGASNFTLLQYRFQDKDFHAPDTLDLGQESRDGQNHMLGLSHILTFAGGRHYVRAGYQFDVDDTQGADYRYTEHKASVGFQVTGPWEVRFQAGYDFHYRDYTSRNRLAAVLNQQALGGATVLGVPFSLFRHDKDHIFTASLSRDFPYGFNTSLEFFKERNVSTLSPFDFDRNVVTFTVGWRY